MLLRDLLVQIYGTTKKGDIKHYAVKFCEKYNLDMEKDYSKTELNSIVVFFF